MADPEKSTAGNAIDFDALQHALQSIQVEPVVLEEAFASIVEGSLSILGIDGAGLMLFDEASVLRYITATDHTAILLEQAQEQAGEGPCMDCVILNQVITVGHFPSDERWPTLHEALKGEPISAVCGVPTTLSGIPVGSFNVYSNTPREWSDNEIQAIAAFNEVVEHLATSAIGLNSQEQLAVKLQRALDDRVVLERAVGILMVVNGVGSVDAYNVLQERARRHKRQLNDVAAEIVENATPSD